MPTTATATTLTITRWRAMGFLEARVAAVALPADQRRTLLAEMGVDEVESLLEHAFFYGDPVYRDQVVATASSRSTRPGGPARGARPLSATRWAWSVTRSPGPPPTPRRSGDTGQPSSGGWPRKQPRWAAPGGSARAPSRR